MRYLVRIYRYRGDYSADVPDLPGDSFAEAYFVGPAMFAFFTPNSMVVRLPPSAFTDAVSHGVARPFLSFGAAQVNGWAEIGFDGREEGDLERWVASAHASGTHAARSAARRRRPARARRIAKR
jgi:hypothetical protein